MSKYTDFFFKIYLLIDPITNPITITGNIFQLKCKTEM